MLQEYLLLVHEDRAMRREFVARTEHLTGLRSVFASPMVTLMMGETPLFVPIGHDGVTVGTIFHRHGPSDAIGAFNPAEAAAIRRSCGTWLIDRCWGSYIAVFDTPSGIQVMRDPSAGMHCYNLTTPGLAVFASDAGVLRRAGLLRPTIDWQHLARHFFTAGLPSALTAIHGVREILPGTSVTVRDNLLLSKTAWTPWNFVEPAAESRDAASEHLRKTVKRSTSAWASCHRTILIGVSGGLDSSIVASCLADTGADLVCMTMATRDPDGDERSFAELLANHLGTELIEEFYALDDIALDRPAAPHLPLPVSRTQSLSYNAAVSRFTKSRSIEAFYTGNGGDNVFAYSYSAAAIYDRYMSEGVSFGVLRTIDDICKLTGCSRWQAAKAALKLARAPTRNYRWKPEPLFLAKDVVEQQSKTPLAHAWLEAPCDARPGKSAHIAGLLRAHQTLQTSERGMGVAVINPLMMQPVIEECLSIPSWWWCDGGVNRAVARSAFTSLLPPTLVRRATKGRPDSFCNEIIDAKRTEIRERLLDGNLAKNYLLDREAVDRSLSDESPNMGFEQVRILSFIEAEAWADHWLSRIV